MSRATEVAPQCAPSTGFGAGNPVGDTRLMLNALTHGWSCEPVVLSVNGRTEAWRWAHDGLLGGEAWSVVGAWGGGPIVDEVVRIVLLLATNDPGRA